jgi:predicted RNA-binding Zn-ribbon protein involved in translation (DUF1610 family)
MARECPGCGKTIGRPVVDRSRVPQLAWYRFSRTRFRCPECGVELRPITRHTGYVLQALILIVFAICGGAAATGELDNFWTIALIVSGVVAIVILGAACGRYGFDYTAD